MEQRDINRLIKALNNSSEYLHELTKQVTLINRSLHELLNSLPKSKEKEIVCDGEKEDKQT